MGLIMKKGVPYASGSEIPEGGTKGQVLAKASNISGDFEWVNGGGGGGNLPMTQKILWETNDYSTNPATITLSDSITNYDMLYLYGWHFNQKEHVCTTVYLNDAWHNNRRLGISTSADAYVWYDWVSNTELTKADEQNFAFVKVVGVNFGDGIVDDTMSDTSENAVQNKVITSALADKVDGYYREVVEATIEIDDYPHKDAPIPTKAGIVARGTSFNNNEVSYIFTAQDIIDLENATTSSPYTLTVTGGGDTAIFEVSKSNTTGLYLYEQVGGSTGLQNNEMQLVEINVQKIDERLLPSGGTSLEASRNNGELKGMKAVEGDKELRVFDDGLVIFVDGADSKSVNLAKRDALDAKQDTLESGTNIKTVAGESLLGSGDIPIPTYVGSGWGVAKTGVVPSVGTSATVNIDISELGLSSVDDYTVNLDIINSGEIYPAATLRIVSRTATSFGIKNTSTSSTFGGVYTVFAKGYGGVPNGGTTGQVLAKKSDADGDTEWVTGGSGGNANFDIGTVPLGGAGVYEVNAILSNNDSERVRAIYSRGVNGEIPDWFSMSVTSGLGTDDFHVATKEYADKEVAKKGNAKITFDNEYQYLQIRDDNGTDIGFSQETAGTVRVQEYAKDSRGQVQTIFDETLPNKAYVDNKANGKQDKLTSGTNIKTVNGESLLGAGNLSAGINIEVNKEKWYGTYTDENGVTYQVYSKMIYIPALPSTAGTTTYPHNISGIKQILQVYGFTTDGFVLNAPRQNVQDNIAIYQMSKSASNQTLSIEVGKDRSSKAAYVVMIYAKNN